MNRECLVDNDWMFIFVCAAPLKACCSAEEKYSQRRWGWRGTGSTWSLSGSLSPWFWFCRHKNISRWGYCSVWQRTWGCSQICLMWTSGDRCHRPADLRGLSGPADRDPDWGGAQILQDYTLKTSTATITNSICERRRTRSGSLTLSVCQIRSIRVYRESILL